MAIKQYYYKVPVGDNLISNIDDSELASGITVNAKKLGIQASPGTQIELNGNAIVIGRTGVYQFEDNELIIKTIKISNPDSGIIIDIMEG